MFRDANGSTIMRSLNRSSAVSDVESVLLSTVGYGHYDGFIAWLRIAVHEACRGQVYNANANNDLPAHTNVASLMSPTLISADKLMGRESRWHCKW
jgi:hypothetical protein